MNNPRLRRVLLLLVYLTVFAWLLLNSSVLAEPPSISFAGVPLQLGGPKEQTLSQLERYFTVNWFDDKSSDSVMIYSKTGPPYEIIGNVAFRNDKIWHIRKYWSPAFEGSDSGPFFKAFFALLRKLQKEGYNITNVSTTEAREPTDTQLNITLTFGRKRVCISYFEHRGTPPSVNLDEVLE